MTTEHQEHQEQQVRNRFPHSRHTHDSSQPIEQNPNDNNAESFSSSSSIHLYNKPSFPETTNCKITQPAIRQDKQDENCILNNSSTINSNNNGNGSNDSNDISSSSSSNNNNNNCSNELDSTSTKPDKIPTKTTTTLETTNEKSELPTIPIQNTSKSNDDSGDNEFSCNICFDQTVGPVLTLENNNTKTEAKTNNDNERDSTCPVCKAGCDREKVIPVYGRGRNEEDPRLTSKIAGTRPTGQRPPAPQYNRHQNPMSLFFDWAGGGGANAPFFPSGGQGHQGAEIPNFHHNTNMGFYMNTGFIGFGPGLFRFNF
ncbi:RING finger protein 5 [Zancudomyces culisetae]|uniref:RING-type E3 ubiquitin transferase n=1 Tax=Zancudomyces culisetae TaxID=1213189 RepID=A0A1R1PJX2_ZANCU|nr:RING finger protein 5 [Zancudomyces culisetae]|eukprot:OMH81261.1 RING finger protein 5 [Zancudomyces culisetae]